MKTEKEQKLDDILSAQLLITPTQLVARVEKLVREDELRYSTAICQVVESLGVEPELIVSIIPEPLKIKLQVEAQKYNNIPPTNTATL